MISRLAGFGSNTTRPAPRRMTMASISHRSYTPSHGSETRPATSCQSSRSEPTTAAGDATNAPQRPRLRRRAAGIQQPPRSSPGGDHPAADGSGLESSAVGAAVPLGQDHLDPAGDVVDQVEQQREQHRHDRPDDHTQQAGNATVRLKLPANLVISSKTPMLTSTNQMTAKTSSQTSIRHR